MPPTLNNFIGFETGGLEEAVATNSTPDVQEVTVRTGAFALEMSSSLDEYDVRIVQGSIDQGDWYVLGYAVRFSSVTANGILLQAFDSVGRIWYLELINSGATLRLRDAGDGYPGQVSSPFTTVDQWHFVEIAFQHLASGQIIVHVDGDEVLNISAVDLTDGGSMDDVDAFYRFTGISGITVHYDDVYCMSGASGVGDFLGDCEVFKYQSVKAGATPDTGGDLDTGSWANVGETPTAAPTAVYGSTGAGSVLTNAANGSPEGPKNDGRITGDIKAMKGFSYMKRTGGGGTLHYILMGNDVDGTTRSADIDPSTAFKGYSFISELASIVPLSTEYCSIGFEQTNAQDYICQDQWAMILHVPGVGGPTTYERAVSRTGSISASVGREGSTFKRAPSRSGAISATVDSMLKLLRAASRTGSISASVDRGGSTYKRGPLRTGAITAAVDRAGSTYRRGPAVTLTLSQALVRAETAIRAINRSGSIAASVARKEIAPRAVVFTGSISAAVDRSGSTYKRASSRSGTVSAAVATVLKIVRVASRSGSVAASVVRTGSTYLRAVARTGAITATIAKALTAPRALSRSGDEVVAVVDRVTKYERALARVGSIVAAVVKALTAPRALSRSGAVAASVVRTGSTYLRAVGRTGAVSASVTGIKKIVKAVSRTGSITTAVVRTGSTYLRAVTRTGTITATLGRGGSTFKRVVARSGTVTATVDAVVKLVRTVSRSGTVTATVDRLSKYKRALTRTGAVTASVIRVLTAVRSLSRTSAITASVVRTGSTYKRAVGRTGAVTASVAQQVLGVIQRALSRSGTITATVSRAGSTYRRALAVTLAAPLETAGRAVIGGAEVAKKLAYYPISLLPSRTRRKGRR